MSFLHYLESIRTPFLTDFFAVITNLGADVAIFVVVAIIYWCWNKKVGLFIMFNTQAIGAVNSLLKLGFCVPRPWLLDPTLNPVAAAVPQATGYSFPSGHTAVAVGIYGSLALLLKKWYWLLSAGILIALIAFSRLYLGVHTPTDVIVSLLISLLILGLTSCLFYYLAQKNLVARKKLDKKILLVGIIITGICIAFTAFFAPMPIGDDIALKADSYTTFGIMLGMLLGWYIEKTYVNFCEHASLPWQAAKVLVGLLVGLALKTLLKAPLYGLMGYSGNIIRYAILMVVVMAVYPWCFQKIIPNHKK